MYWKTCEKYAMWTHPKSVKQNGERIHTFSKKFSVHYFIRKLFDTIKIKLLFKNIKGIFTRGKIVAEMYLTENQFYSSGWGCLSAKHMDLSDSCRNVLFNLGLVVIESTSSPKWILDGRTLLISKYCTPSCGQNAQVIV